MFHDIDKCAIVVHSLPDGDAVGSCLGLYHALERKPTPIILSKISDNFSFLPGMDAVVGDLSSLEDTHFGVLIVLDCANISRIEDDVIKKIKYNKMINIDHHETNERFGDTNIVWPQYDSTGAMIAMLLENEHIEITQEVATCLYLAQISDTNRFSYKNTTANTFDIAAKLLRYGADPHRISKELSSAPFSALKLLGLALEDMHMTESGIVATCITPDDIKTTGSEEWEAELIIDYLQKVSGQTAAIFARGLQDEKVKLSFRSQGNIDVSEIAKAFSGGGHKNASGAIYSGPLYTTMNDAIEKTEAALGIPSLERRNIR